jgi:eukaryotic-like serine/threonine-protein kinase
MGEVMELWSDFEACEVEGRYPLGKLVRTEGRRAWFETQLGEKPALIILTESLNDEDVLVERLRAVEQIQHPNVVAVQASGTTTLKDTPLVYAVTERTEENLEDVLRERPLNPEEAREMLDGLLSALSAIHARGLVHGRMEAANVLASGDTIKLRSDCIHGVPPEGSFESLVGDDIRGLGTVLFQSLTLRRPQNALDPAIQRLPSPFAQIVQRSLGGLSTPAEIAGILRPGAPASVAPASKARKLSPTPNPKTVPVPPAATAKAATLPETPYQVDDDDAEIERTPRWKSPRVIVAVFLALVCLIGYFVYSTLKAPDNPSATAGASSTSASPAQVAKPNLPAVPVAAKPSAGAGIKASPSIVVVNPNASGRTIWRVVAYTYNQRDLAEKKVQEMSAKHADLQPEVFAPKGNRAPYFVSVGGAMDRDQAIQMRERARRLGLPRDTFARNFRQ